MREIRGTRQLRRISVYGFDFDDGEAEEIAHKIAHVVREHIDGRVMEVSPEDTLTDEKFWIGIDPLQPLERYRDDIEATPSLHEIGVPNRAVIRTFKGPIPGWLG